MSILSKTLSVLKKVLGLQDELQIAFGVASLLVQQIEDSSLTGAQKLAWVKEALQQYLPAVAPKIAAKFTAYWPKLNTYIDALVALAKVAKLFSGR